MKLGVKAVADKRVQSADNCGMIYAYLMPACAWMIHAIFGFGRNLEAVTGRAT
jgi:hypothetical protein